MKGDVESLYLWKAEPERTKQLLADYLAFDASAQEEAQSLDETWIADRDLLPECRGHACWAGADLPGAAAGHDENSARAYAGLVDEGPLTS